MVHIFVLHKRMEMAKKRRKMRSIYFTDKVYIYFFLYFTHMK